MHPTQCVHHITVLCWEPSQNRRGRRKIQIFMATLPIVLFGFDEMTYTYPVPSVLACHVRCADDWCPTAKRTYVLWHVNGFLIVKFGRSILGQHCPKTIRQKSKVYISSAVRKVPLHKFAIRFIGSQVLGSVRWKVNSSWTQWELRHTVRWILVSTWKLLSPFIFQ